MIVRSTFYEILALCVILLICIMAAEAEVVQKQQIEEFLPSDGVSLVAVDGAIGNVNVSVWERPEVFVKIIKEVVADTEKKAQEYLDKVEIQIKRVQDKIEIKTEQPFLSALFGRANISLDYQMFVPEGIELDIKTKDGSVYIAGGRGKAKISTSKGDIYLRNMAGSISAKSGSGDIFAEILLDAESSFFTGSGSIDIHIGDDFSVPVSARTFSGPITVFIPDGYSTNVDASVVAGTITCDFPIDGAVEGGSLKGKLFGGGPLLKLNAITGNITVMGTAGAPPADFTVAAPEVAELPGATAVKTSDAPVIDGRLDDQCWISAGRIGDFVSVDAVDDAREPTTAYLLWDYQNLYIGIKCFDSHMADIEISDQQPYNSEWGDDMMQIFVASPPKETEEYYHIAVNPMGMLSTRKLSSKYAVTRGKDISAVEEWDSGGLFDTDIRGDFWSVEARIPFSAMGVNPAEGDVWRLNLYRMEKYNDEHTYWSPTYSLKDWPHVLSRFGKLTLTIAEPEEEPSTEQPAPSEEKLIISHITTQGNEKVSQKEVMDALELKPGDLPDVDALSQAKSRLKSLGWFRDVDVELSENDRGLELIVKVTERNIISPSEVKIRGSKLFTEQQLSDYFSLAAGRITMHDVEVKCKLISKLYRAKGYDMASVACSVVSGELVIDINEGIIDRIEVTGNRRIRTKKIIDALDIKEGMLYKKNEMENAIRTMQDRLPHFSKVDWKPERAADGLNVIHIDVKEELGFKGGLSGTGEFNRVHGLQWGMAAEAENIYTGLKGNSKMLYGFSSEIWNYQFGLEKSWLGRHKTSIGIDAYKLTDTDDRELVSNLEHFIAEAILGEAWRDFYQRKGYELRFGQVLTPATSFGLKYRDDKYTSLEKHSNWSLLDRSYSDDDWPEEFRWTGGRKVHTRADERLDEDEKNKPDNPPIKEGKIRSLIAEYTIDTRNSREDPTNGWLNTFSVEHAGHWLDGDSQFNLYRANIRRYNRLGGNQYFMFRIKAATADRDLPPRHPHKLHLGGIGTLRGYQFKEFSGDKMVLINAEYWVVTNWPPGLGMVFFMDSGYAWPYDTKMETDDMKTNVGVGFQLGGLRVNLASPVGEEDTETILSVRLARMF